MPKDAAPEIMPEMGIESLFNLRGKVALVTGGATGLGKMMAAAYVRNGVRVYIASRKLADLQKQAEVLSKLAPKDAPQPACIALEADVATKAGCDKLADQIKAKESKLHILVNNAGITWGAPMDDFPEDKGWDKIFALNVKSQFYLTVAYVRECAVRLPTHTPLAVFCRFWKRTQRTKVSGVCGNGKGFADLV